MSNDTEIQKHRDKLEGLEIRTAKIEVQIPILDSKVNDLINRFSKIQGALILIAAEVPAVAVIVEVFLWIVHR